QLDLLRHRHAVLGDGRGAERLLQYYVAALGAESDLHRVGERVDTLEDGLTRADVEQDFLGSHFVFLRDREGFLLLDDAEDVFLAHHQMLLAVDLDLGAGVLREQHAVARLDVQGAHLSVLEDLAVSDSDDLALDGLLLGGVGDDDATLRLLFLLHALDDDAILQRPNLHEVFLQVMDLSWHSYGESAKARAM